MIEVENYINDILQYIINIGPSVISIITLVCSAILTIRKCTKLNDDTISEVNNLSSELIKNLAAEREENRQLKHDLARLSSEVHSLSEQVTLANNHVEA